MTARLPLDGITIVDMSRMLPGAVLARCLLDLGPRLIKLEDPRMGDLMRLVPPMHDGVGLGWAMHLRGAESVTLDLKKPAAAAAARKLILGADVMVESFRPGTLERFGLSVPELQREHPKLVVCSLPGYADPPGPTSVGHDLNFVAQSGALQRMGAENCSGIQLADVTSGLLASAAVVAAIYAAERDGVGAHVVQPLAAGPLPYMWWAWADQQGAGTVGATDGLIGGRVPCYRSYRCEDGRSLAVGCLEPKFWAGFCDAVNRSDLKHFGVNPGEAGERAATQMQEHLQTKPAAHWMQCCAGLDLPVTVHHTIAEAADDPALQPLLERLPTPSGAEIRVPGPALPSLGRTPERAAPRLGEHTRNALAEAGYSADEIDALCEPHRR